jgi:crotonobetainyl-CoA:carnitine CoA-transferase CaiB-like acyl-CoA transferase
LSGPLQGIRVLDLTSVVMGPYATQILGDYGADVIKIEPPDGDVMRLAGPMRNPRMGHLYLSTNSSKRSAVIDLKLAEGRATLLHMATRADVLVYNIRPQAMSRLGLGYDEIRAVNPKIIYAGAMGFSQRGPYAARPAYDDLIQGMAGIPWLVQQGGADLPRYAPMILADRIIGLQVANAITSALYHRERTGEGQRIDVPMFEGLASITMGEHLSGRLFDPPLGTAGYKRSLSAERRPYRTSDGYICVMVYNDKQWRSLFDAVGEPGKFSADARFSSQGARLEHIDEVYGYLVKLIETRTTAEWLALFQDADIPAARMNSIDDLLTDEHLVATGFVRRYEHPSEGMLYESGISTEWSHSQPERRRPAPRLGEHTAEVLSEFDIAPDCIARLRAAGVISQD